MKEFLVTILGEAKEKQFPLFDPSSFGQLELSQGQWQSFGVRNC